MSKIYISIFILLSSIVFSQDIKFNEIEKSETLTLHSFIEKSCKNPFFEEILIETLSLKYNEILNIPSRDFVINTKAGYSLNAQSNKTINHGFDGSISLSKLFPTSGTSISTGLSSSSATNQSSSFNLSISQPIAKNAFGYSTRLTKQSVAINNKIIEIQVAEAYEDYFASLIKLYYNWYSNYATLKSVYRGYQTSIELNKETLKKAAYKIADQLDIDKSQIQVWGKLENLYTQENSYLQTLNSIKEAIMDDSDKMFKPELEAYFDPNELNFTSIYDNFINKSRTYTIFELTEEKSNISLKLKADELLPSANFYTNYNLNGSGYMFENGWNSNNLKIGIDLNYSITTSKERASLEVEKIKHTSLFLSNNNKKLKLKTEIENIFSNINTKKNVLKLSDGKIEAAIRTSNNEQKKYNLGKSDLNYLIQAQNSVDTEEQKKISNTINLYNQTIEILRLTDSLVEQNIF